MMNYRNYVAKIEHDPSIDMFHGCVANIRDVITFAARSLPQLEKEFHISVDVYIESCEEAGIEPEKPENKEGEQP